MKYCLSTVIYEGVENQFYNFMKSVGNLPEDVNCLVFNHGADISANAPNCVHVNPAYSIAQVRAFMFSHLKEHTAAELYLFTDSDDEVHPEALQNHRNALLHADFSYGDQHLYLNDFDNNLNTTLFKIMSPPKKLESMKDLIMGNCVGFSALAMSRQCLLNVPSAFPDHIPLLDWWLSLALLNTGMTGARAGVVTNYCLNQQAYDRIFPARSLKELSHRVDIILNMLNTFEPNQFISSYKHHVENLRLQLTRNPDMIEKTMKSVSKEKMMWYQDVFEISKQVEYLN